MMIMTGCEAGRLKIASLACFTAVALAVGGGAR
jgi:hypothetical protein